jgi:hypothetical protein
LRIFVCHKAAVDTKFMKHYIRVMRTKLRNVTVTLEEDVARWARIEAAQRKPVFRATSGNS